MNDDAEIVQEFLVESYENLDQLDRDLVELERSPGSHDLLSSVFRTIHTIKGTSGFLAFQRLESLTHVGEHLLSQLRDGQMTMDTEVAGALLRMVDTVRALLEAVERTGLDTDLGVPVEAMVVELHAVLDRVAPGAEASDHAVLTVDIEVTHSDLTVETESTPTIEERLQESLESPEPLEDDDVVAEFVAVPTAEDTSASTQNDPAPAGADPPGRPVRGRKPTTRRRRSDAASSTPRSASTSSLCGPHSASTSAVRDGPGHHGQPAQGSRGQVHCLREPPELV